MRRLRAFAAHVGAHPGTVARIGTRELHGRASTPSTRPSHRPTGGSRRHARVDRRHRAGASTRAAPRARNLHLDGDAAQLCVTWSPARRADPLLTSRSRSRWRPPRSRSVCAPGSACAICAWPGRVEPAHALCGVLRRVGDPTLVFSPSRRGRRAARSPRRRFALRRCDARDARRVARRRRPVVAAAHAPVRLLRQFQARERASLAASAKAWRYPTSRAHGVGVRAAVPPGGVRRVGALDRGGRSTIATPSGRARGAKARRLRSTAGSSTRRRRVAGMRSAAGRERP